MFGGDVPQLFRFWISPAILKKSIPGFFLFLFFFVSSCIPVLFMLRNAVLSSGWSSPVNQTVLASWQKQWDFGVAEPRDRKNQNCTRNLWRSPGAISDFWVATSMRWFVRLTPWWSVTWKPGSCDAPRCNGNLWRFYTSQGFSSCNEGAESQWKSKLAEFWKLFDWTANNCHIWDVCQCSTRWGPGPGFNKCWINGNSPSGGSRVSQKVVAKDPSTVIYTNL